MSTLLFALLLAAPPALAQGSPDTVEQAKELFMSGRSLYEEGRYEEAIAAWEESYRLSGEPVLLYNIANAYERLARYDEAIEALNRYAAAAPEDERKAIERRVDSLAQRRDARDTTTAEPSPSPSPSPSPAPSARRPVAPVVLMGVGVAGLGTGVAMGLGARGARAEAEQLCVEGLCPAEAADAIARDRRSSLVADLGFALGGVGLASGAVWMVALGSEGQVGLGLGPSWLTLSGTF